MDYLIKLIRKKEFPLRKKWIWGLAWNDAKFNLNRLGLFISSIVIGVGGLVAINGFNDNLKDDIDEQAKELLGADLVVENDEMPPQFSDSALTFIDTVSQNTAKDAEFASMVYFPKSGQSRLIQVVAMAGDFPFYGEIVTTANSNIAAFRQGKSVLIDEPLAIQFNIEIGDSLRLGQGTYHIAGIVTQYPGNASFRATIAPSVYLPYEKLEETGLIQYGSRVEYHYYYQMAEEQVSEIIERLQPLRQEFGFSWDTVEEEKQDLGREFGNLYRYFNLLSFVALILGSVGVASSIFVYMREKRNSAAVLRCLGAGEWHIFWIFFVQVFLLGVAGSILGVIIGLTIQYFLPLIVEDFLPLEVSLSISWSAILLGIAAGLIISVLFSALPLNNIRFVSPLEILRGTTQKIKVQSKFKIVIITLILIFPWAFTYLQLADLVNSTAFYLGLALTFVALYFISKGLIRLVKYLLPSKSPFIWRQGFSNLFRPFNQTSVLVIVIGLGSFLISTMTLIENSLLNQVEFVGSGKRSNTVLFDIQPYQKSEVVDMVEEFELPLQQLVPIVTMKINQFKGKGIKVWQEDTAADISSWRLTREYRVTYRDSLIDSETIVKGHFLHDKVQEGDSVFISVSEDMAEDLNLSLNDEIIFDVQGVPVTTYVGSVRKIDWRRIQTNFMVVFPEGVLEEVPQFYVIITRINDKLKAANFQRELVNQFSNVSLIDLNLILDTLNRIIDKIAFVIRFMALFSILTGMLVLSAAVINSKYARLKENVLLRTIGALKKQIVGITLVEYGFIGFFAGLSGILLSLIGSWVLSEYFFDILFFPDLLSLLVIWLIICVITVFIGWINTRTILNRSPLEVLRKEA